MGGSVGPSAETWTFLGPVRHRRIAVVRTLSPNWRNSPLRFQAIPSTAWRHLDADARTGPLRFRRSGHCRQEIRAPRSMGRSSRTLRQRCAEAQTAPGGRLHQSSHPFPHHTGHCSLINPVECPIVVDRFRFDPAQVDMLEGFRIAERLHRAEHYQELRARVLEAQERLPNRLHLELELLPKLPCRPLKRALSVHELSAGELPKSAMSFVQGPLANQICLCTYDDGGNDRDLRCVRHSRPLK